MSVPDFGASQTASTWKKVEEHLFGGAEPPMPPPKKAQPSAEEVKPIREWLGHRLAAFVAAEEAREKVEGRSQIRRLNGVEYNNTMRDLLGIALDLTPILPDDEAVAGFDNVGSGLQITRIHHERYLEAAELALNAAIATGPRPKTSTTRIT